jgi:hypothetical protein
VTLEVVPVSLCQNAIAIPLSLVPLSFIDVFVLVDHPAFSLGFAVDPVPIVSVSIFVEESSSAMSSIFIPVTRVFSSQLAMFVPPIGALAMPLVLGPHAFKLVLILIELNAKTFLAILLPVSNIS